MTDDEIQSRYVALVAEWSDTHGQHGQPFHKWLTERLMRTEADRDNWRRQALDEDARANNLAADR